jgi:proteasome assembly chaperone (PAC2) family protein
MEGLTRTETIQVIHDAYLADIHGAQSIIEVVRLLLQMEADIEDLDDVSPQEKYDRAMRGIV